MKRVSVYEVTSGEVRKWNVVAAASNATMFFRALVGESQSAYAHADVHDIPRCALDAVGILKHRSQLMR